MATTYTVKKGDTLWGICSNSKYAGIIAGNNTNERIKTLVKLNDITDPDYIVVGQVLKLDGIAPSAAVSKTSKAVIKAFGLQSNTDRTVYATWTWTKSYTENYRVIWYYATGNGVWFVGSDSTVEPKQSAYTAPTNATKVKFKVKPISKKKKVNNKETSYWTANWSDAKTYDFSSNPPLTPPVPSVKIEQYTLTAELENLEVNGTKIQFQIMKDDQSVFKTGTANIITTSASYSCKISAGHEYKVRCRAQRGSSYSGWSEYSSNVAAMPSAPLGFVECKAVSETAVYLDWNAVKTATTYDIEYATEKRYFEGSNQTQMVSGVEFTHYEIGGLETGKEYFFRVRASNEDSTKSPWSKIESIVIGKKPSAPTTWSSVTTAITGETVTLYWVHNAEDGSSQTVAELELIVDGFTETHTITNTTDEDEKDKTSFYVINTSSYLEGTKIEWRVRTAGVTKLYGDWSVQRTIDVNAPATLELSIVDINDEPIEVLTQLPFYISGLAGPNTQKPIGYHLSILSNEVYETVDNIGNPVTVNIGDSVYSKYFETSDPLLVELSAGSLSLENNIEYTVLCTVAMNSGLTADAVSTFSVLWTDEAYEPDIEISIDEETMSASIRAYCQDEYGRLIEGVLLSIYRREYDGSFTELATGLNNTSNTYITDPHPALDYARYRVVAITRATGTVSYYDPPGYPVGGNSIIIQWDEAWSEFDGSGEDALETPPWSGSMLKIPYNIDVQTSVKTDSVLVNYIGRSYPVCYYGTQIDSTATWTVEIPKSDEKTLYAIRRLANWMGDVYVREPSGSGYWANITVSYNQKHKVVIIPVTFSITRVSGGV